MPCSGAFVEEVHNWFDFGIAAVCDGRDHRAALLVDGVDQRSTCRAARRWWWVVLATARTDDAGTACVLNRVIVIHSGHLGQTLRIARRAESLHPGEIFRLHTYRRQRGRANRCGSTCQQTLHTRIGTHRDWIVSWGAGSARHPLRQRGTQGFEEVSFRTLLWQAHGGKII